MKLSIAAIACILFTAHSRAQDSYEKVADEMIPAFTKLGDTLANVKDKKTFEDAKPTFKQVTKTMLDLKERAEKLGEPKGDKKEELEKKYKPKIEEATKKMTTEMVRIATQVEGGQDIVKELSEILAPLNKKKK